MRVVDVASEAEVPDLADWFKVQATADGRYEVTGSVACENGAIFSSGAGFESVTRARQALVEFLDESVVDVLYVVGAAA